MVADFEKRFDPEVRQRYLGGTDASKIMRVNKFERGKPYHLWQEKTGREDPPDLSDNDAVYFGAILEDVVARVYSERSGNNVWNVNRTLIHPEHDFIRGHIDRKIEGKNAGLEVKTVGFRSVHEWGEEGTDEIPAHYECQIMHYLAITKDEVLIFDAQKQISEYKEKNWEDAREDSLLQKAEMLIGEVPFNKQKNLLTDFFFKKL